MLRYVLQARNSEEKKREAELSPSAASRCREIFSGLRLVAPRLRVALTDIATTTTLPSTVASHRQQVDKEAADSNCKARKIQPGYSPWNTNEAEVRRLPHANSDSDLVPQFVTSHEVFSEFKPSVTLIGRG
jgi:hypothetical protein